MRNRRGRRGVQRSWWGLQNRWGISWMMYWEVSQGSTSGASDSEWVDLESESPQLMVQYLTLYNSLGWLDSLCNVECFWYLCITFSLPSFFFSYVARVYVYDEMCIRSSNIFDPQTHLYLALFFSSPYVIVGIYVHVDPWKLNIRCYFKLRAQCIFFFWENQWKFPQVW